MFCAKPRKTRRFFNFHFGFLIFAKHKFREKFIISKQKADDDHSQSDLRHDIQTSYVGFEHSQGFSILGSTARGVGFEFL